MQRRKTNLRKTNGKRIAVVNSIREHIKACLTCYSSVQLLSTAFEKVQSCMEVNILLNALRIDSLLLHSNVRNFDGSNLLNW